MSQIAPFTATAHNKSHNKSRFTPKLLLISTALACGISSAANADEITKWNEALLQTAFATAPVLDGNRQFRALTQMHIAMFDAANSIDHQFQQYHFYSSTPGASQEAAVAQAAHDVLVNYYPTATASFDTIVSNTLASVSDANAKASAITLGKAAAADIMALRVNDHVGDVVPYTVGNNPGDWRPTGAAQRPAANTQWPLVQPYALTSNSQFRDASGPPALDSAAYAAALNEVRSLGDINSATRTADQTNIAKFWFLGGGTTNTVIGLWNRIAASALTTHPHSLLQDARLFALLNMSEWDDFIGSNDDKIHFNLWRPETAIHLADTDNNPLTTADLNWTPLLAAPPFPSYVSNHSSLDGAASTVLASFFGTDDIAFTASTQGFVVPDRSFTSFSQAAAEGGRSRIFAGIHFEFDNQDGLALGRNVGAFVFANQLQAVPEPRTWTLAIGVLAWLVLRARRRVLQPTD